MTPAIGTSPTAVMKVLEQTLSTGKRLDASTIRRFDIRESKVLGTHRVREPANEDEPRTLIADYWVTVPRSKRVLLITFGTGLVDITDEMLGLFDSILAASYWKRRNSLT